MPERLRLSTATCVVLMLLLICTTTHSSLSRAVATDQSLNSSYSNLPIVVVLGLSHSLNDDVKQVIDTEFADRNLSVIDLADQSLPSFVWPENALIVAAGMAGCEQTVAAVHHLHVQCVLLTEENFKSIQANALSTELRSVSALVIDQPVARQAKVAQSVYPALSRFAVLSESSDENSVLDEEEFLLDRGRYRSSLPLAPQLSEVLATNDALIAIPESSVFNRTTLRTVLLTAYGYGKPVIGLSRAYVKAGALITAYSTPAQVFREIAERVSRGPTLSTSPISYPRYFSIVDNINVAKSLRLTKLMPFDTYATFTDTDFQP